MSELEDTSYFVYTKPYLQALRAHVSTVNSLCALYLPFSWSDHKVAHNDPLFHCYALQ